MFTKLMMIFHNTIKSRIRYLFTVFFPKHLKSIVKIGARKVFILALIFTILISIPLISVLKTTNLNKASPRSSQEISYNEFLSSLNTHQIDTITDYKQNAKKITGKFKNTGKIFTTDNPQSNDLKKYLLEKGVKFEDKPFIETIPEKLIYLMGLVLPMIIIIMAMGFIMNRIIKKQSSGNNAKFEVIKKCTVTFDHVAGNEEAKENMIELVDFLTAPQRFTKYGIVPPKGTVLFGPPGTGKTLLAKALAGTAGVPFLAVSGSDFVEKFVGVGASRIRQLFKLARKTSPCIVFIDEIDALGKRSSSDGAGANDERDRTINQILVEIDGFSGSEGIIVIAATNRLDMLDPALLRSGRFDRQIQVALPDLDARIAILELCTKNKPVDSRVDLKEVAKMTAYMSGADLANIMNEAGIYAIRSNHTSINMKDIDKAISKLHAGEEKKNKKNITQKDKEITAYHEAGHALVAKLLSGFTVSKVTIIPTTRGAGGYTLYLPEEKMFSTKKDLSNDIAVFLGGRAAEEITFGEEEVTNGASHDLKQATQIASDMVKHFGMSHAVGLVSFQEVSREFTTTPGTNVVEREVKTIIEDVYKNTKELLSCNQDCLHQIASMLLERETIYRKDIDNLIENTMFHRSRI
ncbi:MAG: ATP-dependent zinc metalloprotease FtsH [Clostridia bacterium]|nr:ATP-dependent zinc metalloprotease FtsH [Clostridia bacterium]